MTPEEKAKRYDEAFAYARNVYRLSSNPAEIQRMTEIFPELIESEDEKVRKAIIDFFSEPGRKEYILNGFTVDSIIAWLEKQGERKPTDKIEIGKKYQCIASPRYSTFRRGEIYKPVDNFLCNLMNLCSDCFEPIEDSEHNPILDFKAKDWYVSKVDGKIHNIYYSVDKTEPKFHVGDTVRHKNIEGSECTIEFIDDLTYFGDTTNFDIKDQNNWELVEQKSTCSKEDEEYNGEDYGIDGLWHAMNILERTLGKVSGYQTDDGILSHQCAITAVKKLYKQKSSWSEEDERILDALITSLNNEYFARRLETLKGIGISSVIDWLKSLKNRVQSQSQHKEWSEDDEEIINKISVAIATHYSGDTAVKVENWLKSLRPQLKYEWSEEDDKRLKSCLNILQPKTLLGNTDTINTKWLKSLKERYTWRPSKEQMDALDSTLQYSQVSHNSYEHLNSLYNNLKKLTE